MEIRSMMTGPFLFWLAKLVQVEYKSKIYFDFVETPPNLEAARPQRSASRIQKQNLF